MARDVFRFINEIDPATLQAIGERLEFRGTDATFNEMRDAYFDDLPLASAGAVLDVGCGTGVEVRALLARPGFTGRVVAVDQSPALVETARRLAAAEGLGGRVDFTVGDAHRLELPEETFDVVIAHTLLSHVADPLRALGEMVRVTRPGGTVAVFDGDYASWTWSHPDPALAAAMNDGLLASVVANPRLMREMPRLLREVGLELVGVRARVYAEVGTGRFFPAAAETYGPLIARAGSLPAADVERWLTDLRRALDDRTFFAACNYYACVAERPRGASSGYSDAGAERAT
jgi:ubiquinone/menaquinone biosynthesis C-methylase UbiE